jgi:FtsZ-binding cell division protein ZapB
MAVNLNSVIDKLGEQIKNMTIIIAVLQTELEELRKAKQEARPDK